MTPPPGPLPTCSVPRIALSCAFALFLFPCFSLFAQTELIPAPKLPFRDPPHSYWSAPPTDPFAQKLGLTTPPAVLLNGIDDKTRLLTLLKTLDIPESSQLLVYSATSLQSGLILPTNPRALYFNEHTYVGFVPTGRIEIASIDPALGPVFYVSKPATSTSVSFLRSERCMNCHAGRTSWQLPGMVAESVIPTHTGASLDGFRREIVGHQIPLKERLGGWHVTGSGQHAGHLGNLMGEATPAGYRTFQNPPGSRFDWAHYPSKNSDLFTHLIHEHQLGFHNLVTLAVYRTREALSAGHGSIRPIDQPSLEEIAHRLLRYILFADEAALPPGGILPEGTYLKDFLARRVPTKGGASLRDTDLKTRIFRYRCSYMILTDSFRALPREFKHPFIARLRTALDSKNHSREFGYLPEEEKDAIRSILEETEVL